MSADTAGLAALSAAFSGTILTAEDNGYDDARRIHNGLIDKHPALSPVVSTPPTSSTRSTTVGMRAWRSQSGAAVTTLPGWQLPTAGS